MIKTRDVSQGQLISGRQNHDWKILPLFNDCVHWLVQNTLPWWCWHSLRNCIAYVCIISITFPMTPRVCSVIIKSAILSNSLLVNLSCKRFNIWISANTFQLVTVWIMLYTDQGHPIRRSLWLRLPQLFVPVNTSYYMFDLPNQSVPAIWFVDNN